MAVRQRKDRGTWQVYWRNPYTKKQESVFCSSLLEAQKTDDQVKYRLRWETESFRPADEPEMEVTDTLGGILYAYLEDRKLNRTGVEDTMYRCREAIRRWGDTPISRITAKDLVDLMAALVRKQSPGTVRIMMKRLRTVFLWARRHGVLESVPVWPEMPEHHYEHFVPPSQDEIRRIVAVAPDYVRRIVILGTQLGVRVGPCELYKMTWDDMDLDDGVCHVRASRKNKNEPIRDVPLKPSLVGILRAWKADDEANGKTGLIIQNKLGHAVTQICIWKKILRLAGITRRIRPYDLRHAFATELMAQGVDVGTVAKLMGHADATMVLRHYQHVTTAQKLAAIAALPDVPVCPAPYAQPTTTANDKHNILQ